MQHVTIHPVPVPRKEKLRPISDGAEQRDIHCAWNRHRRAERVPVDAASMEKTLEAEFHSVGHKKAPPGEGGAIGKRSQECPKTGTSLRFGALPTRAVRTTPPDQSTVGCDSRSFLTLHYFSHRLAGL